MENKKSEKWIKERNEYSPENLINRLNSIEVETEHIGQLLSIINKNLSDFSFQVEQDTRFINKNSEWINLKLTGILICCIVALVHFW